jgi:predicted ATP-grasp superfamily ATP-dependent carboligase
MQRSEATAKGKRVFLYEHVSGGGMADEPLPPSWLAEGQAMLRAVVEAFVGAGCEVVTTCDARFEPHLPVETIPIDHASSVADMIAKLQRETDHGLIVAPETGGALLKLTRIADRVPFWNLGSNAAAVETFGDKLQTARKLAGLGIRHAETVTADKGTGDWPDDARLILKPIDGAGTLETYLLNDATHMASEKRIMPIAEDLSRFVVQRHVSGISMSLSALCDGRGGVAPIGVCRHRLRTEPLDTGIFELVSLEGESEDTADTGRLEAALSALKACEGLCGWVGVDVIFDPVSGLDTVIEINPRLTSAFVWLGNRTNPSGIARRWLAFRDRIFYDEPESNAPNSAS